MEAVEEATAATADPAVAWAKGARQVSKLGKIDGGEGDLTMA